VLVLPPEIEGAFSGTVVGGLVQPLGPDPQVVLGFQCQTLFDCQSYNPSTVDWSLVYSTTKSLMQCEKRIANMVIRTCFHESGAVHPSDPASGPNASGFCTREHRRPENTQHNFFDHAMTFVHSIAKKTGASPMDALSVACFVAYEVTGGDKFVANVGSIRLGRCDKTAASSAMDPANLLPAADLAIVPFLQFWANTGFQMDEAAALMTTHTLMDGKGVNMHFFDLEYVHLLAHDFNKLGYRCDATKLTNLLNPFPGSPTNPVNANEVVMGFTHIDLGANLNFKIAQLWPFPFLPEIPPLPCKCYDPVLGGDQTRELGGWVFTVNDCNVWRACQRFNDPANFINSTFPIGNISPADLSNVQAYCAAFKTFSTDDSNLYTALMRATHRLTGSAIWSGPSNGGTTTVDYGLLKASSPVPNLCVHKTPCSTTVAGGCASTGTCHLQHCQQHIVNTNHTASVGKTVDCFVDAAIDAIVKLQA
jgi:hypothetical protein